MSNIVARYICPNVGAVLYVNGFIVVGAEENGRFNLPIAPYLRPGVNLIEVVSRAPGAAELTLVDMSGGDSESAPVLLQSEGPVPIINQSLWRGELKLGVDVPIFSWHTAQRVTNPEAHKNTLYGHLQTMQQLLKKGPDDRLLQLLALKHTEIGNAVGIGQGEMDAGLSEGLAAFRAQPGFRVDLTPYDSFVISPSSDGKIINARRSDGGDALTVMDGDANGGFSVAFASIDDRWVVAR